MKRLLLASVCSGALFSVPAAAQEEVEDTITVRGTRAVAATKTDTPIAEVPQAISIVTVDEIRERTAVDFQDVFRYTPGVQSALSIDSRGDFVSSRGFEAAQYLDGLKRMPDFIYGARLEPCTRASAEVLRGPSSVLYGAGGPGGVLNGRSKLPEFEFAGEVGAYAGSDERVQAQLDITGPVSDSIAVRLVSLWREGETQWGTPDDRLLINPSIRFQPTADTDISLVGIYQEDMQGSLGYAPLYKSYLAGSDAERVDFNFYQGEPGFNGMDTAFASIALLGSHDFGAFTFTSATRYSDMDTDYKEVYSNYTDDPWADAAETLLKREFYVNYEKSQVLNTDNHISFDLATGPLEHQVLFGVDYTSFEQSKDEGFSCYGFCWADGPPPPINIYDPQPTAPFTFGAFNSLEYESTQLGLYFQDQVTLYDRVHIVLGARRDNATSKRNGVSELDQTEWSFRGGIIAEIIDGVSPYVNYSESFLPVPGGDFYGNSYEPRLADQFEAGIKWEPVSGALIAVSYFDIEESNILSQDLENIQNFIQGGSVGSTGFEVEAVYRAAGYDLTASYSYIEAEALTDSQLFSKGDRVADLPESLASIWLSKSFAFGNDFDLRTGLGVRYIGDRIDATQSLTLPSETLVDASLTLTHGKWEASITASNLFNVEYYASCSVLAVNHGLCTAAKDRTFIAGLRRKF